MILKEIEEKLKKSKIHMTLIDPASQSPAKTAEIALAADQSGTDFLMVGGSTDIDKKILDESIDSIRKVTDRKIIIFPGSASMVSEKADALYFMSLLNSGSLEFVVGHQFKAAPYIKSIGLETISMGYIIVEPGMTAGRAGKAELIRRNDLKSAASYAMMAELFGMKLVYLEAGSGAPEHVPSDMITFVKRKIGIPLIVGGGIRSVESAREVAQAGADIVVTGTVAEKSERVMEVLEPIIAAVRQAK